MFQKLSTALLRIGTALCLAPMSVAAARAQSVEVRVSYHTAEVDGIKIFYREAGDPNAPTILLLHGFPSSSHEFRDLLPELAGRFHLVAPDYPGAGYSDAPPAEKFKPNFDTLANVMAHFVSTIGLKSYILYMHDFGGPVGFRIAIKNPSAVNGLIIQNANAYLEGIAPDVLQGMKERAAGTLAPDVLAAQLQQVTSPAFTLFQYKTGAHSFATMSPDGYSFDNWILEDPEKRRIQAGLIQNYYANVEQYPAWHDYLKTNHPKTLFEWGQNDPIFLRAGVEAMRKDLPDATVNYFDTGHFALEEDAVKIASDIIATFGAATP